MLQLILYRSFIPCIGLPLLKSIWCTLLDLVRGITLLRNIFSVAAVEILVLSDCGCYCYVLCDVDGQLILQLSDYNRSFSRVCLLFTILLISIVCIGLRLTNVIIMHLTPQLEAYSRQQYFEALVKEAINDVVMEFVKDAYGKEKVFEDL